jgi:hypothetical protein
MDTQQLLRFQSAYAETSDGCWAWSRALDNGYGRFWLNGRNRLAHAVSYEHFVGPIPDGLQIDHLCRNRSCVRPDHLEAVTLGVNVLRGEGRSATNSRKELCLRGHALSGDNLYVTPRGSRCCRTCQRARVASWRARVSA